MAGIETTTWSETAGSNNAATPNGWPEGQNASTVNDCAREMMAAVKRLYNRDHPTITAGGTADAMTLTYTTAPAAYVAGMEFTFITVGTNTTTTPSVNVNGLGAKTIKRIDGSTAVAAGELVSGTIITLYYDGTSMRLQPGGIGYGYVGGTLEVSGATVIGSTLEVVGLARMDSTLSVSSYASFAAGTSANQGVNYSQFPATISATGSFALPNGIVMKWGTGTYVAGVGSVAYAAAFPTATRHVIVSLLTSGAAHNSLPPGADPATYSTTGFTVYGGAGQSGSFSWRAIGN